MLPLRWFLWPMACLAAGLLLSVRGAAADGPAGAGYRWSPLRFQAGSPGRSGFGELDAVAAGIRFTNRLDPERSLTNQIFLNGSGVALGDVDGDGLADVYLCGLDSPNALYRNRGDWRFEEVTATSGGGVACADQASTGAVFADVDGDGDLDLLVNAVYRGTRLFENDGKGRFAEITDAAGLRHGGGATSFALADVDGDGWLDLYVVNYRSDTLRDMPDTRFRFGVTNGVSQLLTVNGRPATAPDLIGRFSFDQASGVMENGEAHLFFRNRGRGRFAVVDWSGGAFLDENGAPVSTPYDWGLSAMFRDLNGDGAPDLYVCNDFQSPDRIWMNDGRGGFRAAAFEAFRHTSLFSMGIDVADVDRDGFDDLFVADMLGRDHASRQVQVMDAMAFSQYRNANGVRPQYSRNMLFRNRGDGTYAELAQLAGVDASDWTWCPVFLDVDLDGYEDLLMVTGHERDAQHADIAREIEGERQKARLSAREQLRLRRRFPRLEIPNVAFRNRGDWTFAEVGAEWGFQSRRIAQGIALADLDADGDLDAVINCLNDGPLLLRNETTKPRVAVRLRGAAPNTRGIGARIVVRAPGMPAQSQEVICGGRYLSGDDTVRTFATRGAQDRVTIEVAWRGGKRTVLGDAMANRVYEIDEANAALTPSDSAAAPGGVSSTNRPALLEDVSARLGHRHADEPEDDFARQSLLPRRLTTLGPGVAWFDFNGDGWEDLLIGTGRGGRPGVFRNDAKGGFVRQRAQVFESPADHDQGALLGWRSGGSRLALIMGQARDPDGPTNAAIARELSLVTGVVSDLVGPSVASTGPMAIGDLDGDGDLDLFVGGRAVPGRYPEPARSSFFRNENGGWRLDVAMGRVLGDAGMVSDALVSDLDGDGRSDLALACDWGPIRLYRNTGGPEVLRPWNPPLTAPAGVRVPATLEAWTGWWNSVAAGDLDADGRMDLVVGNWGRNTSRERFLAEPLRLYYGDADGSGRMALLEAQRDPGLGAWVPGRDWAALGAVFPSLLERFAGFAAFGRATVDDALSAGLPPMARVSAATLDSGLLLNRGDHFEWRPLPLEAQVSPVFGLAVTDLDGDGHQDVIVSQNFHGVAPVESRHDAGVGAWLRGDGRGGLAAVPSGESGFRVNGEGRGLAVADFDHDGRVDVVVGQHQGETRLFRNVGGRPGLRLQFMGPDGNPMAIGASIRLVFAGDLRGPVTELRAGGGYWSQDAASPVLATPVAPEAVEIRWPGGPVERVAVPPGTRSLEVRYPAVR